MREAVKGLTREIIWSLPRRRLDERKRPICIYANRRGGSTHLMEIIGANKGVRYCGQPFSVYTASYDQLRLSPSLPVRHCSQFTSVHREEEEEVRSYISAVLDGRAGSNFPLRFWASEYDFVYDRLVLKIVDAKALIDWIDHVFSVDTVYYSRHPVPVALSVLRRGWGDTCRAYLQDAEFSDSYLSGSLVDYCWNILKSQDVFAKAIVNWCLENIVPIRLLPHRPKWLGLTYERLVANPESSLHRLASALGLEDLVRMRRALLRPSKTSAGLLAAGHSKEARTRLINSWMQQVDSEHLRIAGEILDRFEISLYRPDRAEPSDGFALEEV